MFLKTKKGSMVVLILLFFAVMWFVAGSDVSAAEVQSAEAEAGTDDKVEEDSESSTENNGDENSEGSTESESVKEVHKYSWRTDSRGNWMCMTEKGIMVRDEWIESKGARYYLKPSGYMAEKEWIRTGNGWCYVDKGGKQVFSKWIRYSGFWYYIKDDGYMADNEVVETSSGTYNISKGGKLLSSKWYKDSGYWYYIKEDGTLAADEMISTDKGMCYLGSDGRLVVSKWFKLGENWYFADKNGYLKTGPCMIKGSWYRFDESGAMITGWYTGADAVSPAGTRRPVYYDKNGVLTVKAARMGHEKNSAERVEAAALFQCLEVDYQGKGGDDFKLHHGTDYTYCLGEFLDTCKERGQIAFLHLKTFKNLKELVAFVEEKGMIEQTVFMLAGGEYAKAIRRYNSSARCVLMSASGIEKTLSMLRTYRAYVEGVSICGYPGYGVITKNTAKGFIDSVHAIEGTNGPMTVCMYGWGRAGSNLYGNDQLYSDYGLDYVCGDSYPAGW